MRPIAEGYGHDLPGLIDELAPRFAAMFEDIFAGFENVVGEPVVAHEPPDVFHRVELGRFRRRGEDGDVWWNDELRGHMPAGLISQQHRMGSRRNGFGDLGQMQVHRFGVAGRQNQSRAFALLRADSAEDVG